MNDRKKLIKLLLNELESKKILKTVNNSSFLFHDEPKFFFYTAGINNSPKYYEKRGFITAPNKIIGPSADIVASGTSAKLKYLALLKCLSEAIERFSLCCLKKKSVFFSSYLDLNQEAIDLTLYIEGKSLTKEIYGWIKGYNLTEGTQCLIPAQLVYLNYLPELIYQKNESEILLSQPISTGAAGGFSRESTLLRAIYEVIERDAFMTIYLNKIRAPRIDINSIRSRVLSNIRRSFQRYNLELYLFNITNDLEIPSFMAIIVDKTGLGRAISVGIKASLSILEAIIGSIEEAYMGRIWVRNEMMKRKGNSYNILPEAITTHLQRALFWSSPTMLDKLNFLINKSETSLSVKNLKYTPKEELLYIKKVLKRKNYSIYFSDITLDNFRKLNFLVYKAIVPGLQPLYLDEGRKELRVKRLKMVSNYFKKRSFSLNELPHPLV